MEYANFTKFSKKGNLNIVAIPKTIDNDVGATDSSIGFDTAVQCSNTSIR